MCRVYRFRVGEGRQAYAAVSELLGADSPSGSPAPPERLAKFLASEDNFLIGAFSHHRPIGFLVAYQFHRVDQNAVSVYLYDVFVVPSYRRRGVATAMVNLLREESSSSDLNEIWVGSGKTNSAACALWESLGARRVAEDYVEFVFREDP